MFTTTSPFPIMPSMSIYVKCNNCTKVEQYKKPNWPYSSSTHQLGQNNNRTPESNVLPKILPFWCKNGGVICLWGVNWCKSVGVICSEGVKWCKSWAAKGGLLRNYPPWLKLPCKSGLQWAAMGGLLRNYPHDWNCRVRVGCNGLQREDFSGITPMTEIVM